MSNCIFCAIIAGAVPAKIIWQNDAVIAINDIAPKADVHILVIPKKHIPDMIHLHESDAPLAGNLLLAVRDIAKQCGLESFRLVGNNGAQAGQSVFHLHLHMLAGSRIPGMLSADL